MNRGLVYSLCAAAMFAASPALAVVDVQLNLKYTDPANATGGGTWQLLVKSTGAQGLAGLSAKLGGALGVTGVDAPAGAVSSTGAAFDNVASVFRYQLTGGKVEVVAGDDLAGAKILNVGKGAGTPANVPADDLFTNGTSASNWNNSALIASGSWTGARPTLVAADIAANEFDGSGNAVAATLGTVSVRGDSVGVDGLKPGDANRDGRVNLSDFAILSGNYNNPSAAKTWDQGDFNGSTGGVNEVNLSDFAILSGNYNQASPSPAAVAAVGAVPEPASLVLVALGVLGLGCVARRS